MLNSLKIKTQKENNGRSRSVLNQGSQVRKRKHPVFGEKSGVETAFWIYSMFQNNISAASPAAMISQPDVAGMSDDSYTIQTSPSIKKITPFSPIYVLPCGLLCLPK